MSGATATGHGPRVHDIVAIGLGPFNLGLAALADPVAELDVVVLEQRAEFRWHPGMMIEGATIQVPFLADLVTMADPTSVHSFVNWLKHTGRLYRFYIRESFYPLRAEYDAYCRWVATRLRGIHYESTVVDLRRDEAHWVITSRTAGEGDREHRARNVVLGIGTAPVLPAPARAVALRGANATTVGESAICHTADYLDRRAVLAEARHVTVVGSGQSAAEVYRDLLDLRVSRNLTVDWMTRSARFFPMEYTKLTLEMTSPEYVRYFHALPASRRATVADENLPLYKGITGELINEIHETLYRIEAEQVEPIATRLMANSELIDCRSTPGSAEGALRLSWRHVETGHEFSTVTDALVCGTGYRSSVPDFLDDARDALNWDEEGRFDVALDFTVDEARTVFVQNAEEHTHGLSAPDLGMGAWRNAQIINSVVGREVYPVERRIAFQQFGGLGAEQ